MFYVGNISLQPVRILYYTIMFVIGWPEETVQATKAPVFCAVVKENTAEYDEISLIQCACVSVIIIIIEIVWYLQNVWLYLVAWRV